MQTDIGSSIDAGVAAGSAPIRGHPNLTQTANRQAARRNIAPPSGNGSFGNMPSYNFNNSNDQVDYTLGQGMKQGMFASFIFKLGSEIGNPTISMEDENLSL